MGVKCFLVEPVAKIRVWARRYSKSHDSDPSINCPKSPGQYSYHNGMNLLGDFDFPLPSEGEYEQWTDFVETLRPAAGDPRWPAACECGVTFENSDTMERGGQMFVHRLHKRSDNGELVTLRDAPAGAMWLAWWMKHEGRFWDWDNQTEAPLICKTPGGEWNIDGRASNCTMPNDRVHRCWVRHGNPPIITVDKNGQTCAAGGGSIAQPNWHGFLSNGELVTA
jgi:hypothetical protein